MRFHLFLLLVASLFTPALSAQQASETGLYFIGFKDKVGTPFTIDEPERLFSPRALERRAKQQVAVTEMDLPISPIYERKVADAGAEIWLRAKWMNGLVAIANAQQIRAIRALPFVDTVYYTAPLLISDDGSSMRVGKTPQIPNLDRPAPVVYPDSINAAFYGAGWPNLEKMKGDSLHRWGYRGQGMLVAVLDGGFPMVNHPGYLGHQDSNSVPANWDLVDQDDTALDGGNHGSTVLSTMAAHHPFFTIGMAPEARYVLFKTENGRGEHRLEEINYAIALEIADSIGVDVVNSSLGYTTFNDKTMDYTYADLNGKTSPASIAADRAFERGMIIVTSAGNSGGDEWQYIGTPADAEHIFSVGALDGRNDRAYFSSFGPSSDGRIKPDVAAPGVAVPGIATNGRGIRGSNGTSLSSPLVAALLTCLWQAFPEASNADILEAVKQTASHAQQPNNSLGHGLPDFAAAYRYLQNRK